ncbi:DUF84 family protein [Fictibacillus sp. Mic-4]|uniref:DUF84 family protein n=1 Tax=Fictibacillus sp. Mic-4 TaxID=3132826 RepID=UPI003CED7AAE
MIAIGSKNPAKVKAVKQVLNQEVVSFEVPSGVSAQPFSDEETKRGAVNRAKKCVEKGAEIGIGLEGGVTRMGDVLYLCNWGALVDSYSNTFVASGAKIPLPESIAAALYNGSELGDVMAELTSDQNVSKKEGAIGIFTNGIISRDEMFVHIVKMLYGQYLCKMG